MSDKKMYGTYVKLECNSNMSQRSKAEIILQGIQQLFSEIEAWEIDLDFNTMEIVIREGLGTENSFDPFSKHPEAIESMRNRITVGVKCEGVKQ